jgi:hypothetical protein
MPAQARGLKKYRCGTAPVSSTSDNEHATAALWNSEVLSVEHSVGPPIPEFCHPPKEGAKVPSSIGRQDTGDVLPNQPGGAQSVSQAKIFEGQVPAGVGHSLAKSGDAERLAGRSSDKKVNCIVIPCIDFSEVAAQRHGGVMVMQHRAGEGFDFRKESRAPAQRLPRYGSGLNPGTNAAVG